MTETSQQSLSVGRVQEEEGSIEQPTGLLVLHPYNQKEHQPTRGSRCTKLVSQTPAR